MIKKSKKRHNANYICEDCVFIFQIYEVLIGNPKYFCPKCGDSIAVKPYTGEHREVNKVWKRIEWRDDELEVIEQCIKGKLRPIQAAYILGRSVDSVGSKVKRMKKKNGGAHG